MDLGLSARVQGKQAELLLASATHLTAGRSHVASKLSGYDRNDLIFKLHFQRKFTVRETHKQNRILWTFKRVQPNKKNNNGV